MNIFEKLQKIQYEMKAPKNLFNKFGNYSYRNAEGILEAFKPYGDKYKVVLVVSDNIKMVGDRTYVEAIATLYDTESDEVVTNVAYARESEDKKGMDASQVTGATSSYARKYALNGLFLLDDTKDADTNEYHEQTSSRITAQQLGKIKAEMLRTGIPESDICKRYKVVKLEEMDSETAEKAIRCLGKSKDAN